MNKTIKVSEETYKELEGILEPRETFNDAVQRALKVYRTIADVAETLGPSHYLTKRSSEVVLGQKPAN